MNKLNILFNEIKEISIKENENMKNTLKFKLRFN